MSKALRLATLGIGVVSPRSNSIDAPNITFDAVFEIRAGSDRDPVAEDPILC